MKNILLQGYWKRVSRVCTPEEQVVFLRDSLLLHKHNPTQYFLLWISIYVMSWVFRLNTIPWLSWFLLWISIVGMIVTSVRFFVLYRSFIKRWGAVGL